MSLFSLPLLCQQYFRWIIYSFTWVAWLSLNAKFISEYRVEWSGAKTSLKWVMIPRGLTAACDDSSYSIRLSLADVSYGSFSLVLICSEMLQLILQSCSTHLISCVTARANIINRAVGLQWAGSHDTRKNKTNDCVCPTKTWILKCL